MPAIWNGTLSTGRFEALVVHPGLPLPVLVRPHPRARRLKLRLADCGGHLLLTVPARGSRRSALAWAATQRDWVETQIIALMPGEPIDHGGRIPLNGEEVHLEWRVDAPRTPQVAGDLLTCGGPREAFASRIERWLRTQARETLSKETAAVAEQAGVTVRAVSVGDAASRWGSCSASGSIRYNWRLILAPPAVRRFVVAHEVAHRIEMNHGPRFKALEERLFGGDVAAARSELRRIGPRLKRIGRHR